MNTPTTTTNQDAQLAEYWADWLVDAVAGATQDPRFLRCDPHEDRIATGAILANGRKAITNALHKLRASLAETPMARSAEQVTVLPDGSAFAVMSLPLPADHWLTQPGDDVPPMPWRMGTSAQRDQLVADITRAARYAVRASTQNGAEDDFDPDAMVRNMVVGLLGYFTSDGLSSDPQFNPPMVPNGIMRCATCECPTLPESSKPQHAGTPTTAEQLSWRLVENAIEAFALERKRLTEAGEDRVSIVPLNEARETLVASIQNYVCAAVARLEAANTPAVCSECHGDGYITVPVCCGHGRGGECCLDPEPSQEPCPTCTPTSSTTEG